MWQNTLFQSVFMKSLRATAQAGIKEHSTRLSQVILSCLLGDALLTLILKAGKKKVKAILILLIRVGGRLLLFPHSFLNQFATLVRNIC